MRNKSGGEYWDEAKEIKVCKDCGSKDYPYHDEGCTMGDIGWKTIKRKGVRFANGK